VTLIESLVVVGIIVVLIAILMPALKAAREAARRASCVANLKQLGIALQTYHDILLSYPIGRTGLGYVYPWSAGPNRRTWALCVLPFMEKSADFQTINFAVSFRDPPNSTVIMTTIAVFHCPSDPNGESIESPGAADQRIVGNYVVNWGNTHYAQNAPTAYANGPNPFNGPMGEPVSFGGAPFTANTTVAIAELTDGTSHTLLLGEVIVGAERPGTTVDTRGDVYNDDFCATMFMTYTGPNAACPDALGPNCNHPFATNPPCTPTTPAFNAARSFHPGGVGTLRADGSVKFINDSVTLPVWRALSTPAGVEALSDDSF
jgi:hypothetical protein